MKKISFLFIMLFAAFMVKAADPVTLFYEGFNADGHHAVFNPLTDGDLKADSNPDYAAYKPASGSFFFADDRFVMYPLTTWGARPLFKTDPNDNTGLNLIINEGGATYTGVRIQIKTTGFSEAYLTCTVLQYWWGAFNISYSTDGTTYTPFSTADAEEVVREVGTGGDGSYYTIYKFSENLAGHECVILKFEKGGDCVLYDDVTVTGIPGSTPPPVSDGVLFYENFDGGNLGDVYKSGPANEIDILEGNHMHYTDEVLEINNSNAITDGVAWASKNRTLTFTGAMQSFTIKSINTTGKKNIKFQYATIYGWNPTGVQYKIGEAGTWSASLPKPTPTATAEGGGGSTWELLTYTLPAAAEGVEDLWVRVVGGSGYCNSDDFKITADDVDPIDLAETKNLLNFNLADLTADIDFDRTRAVLQTQPDPELMGNDAPDGAFIAVVDFDETTPLMQNAAGDRDLDGVLAFKGGAIVDHSHYTAEIPRKEVSGISLTESVAFPNLNNGDKQIFAHGGPNETTGTATYERAIYAFVWTKDQFANGGADERIIINGSSKVEIELPEFFGNNSPSVKNGTRVLIKNGSQYYISEKRWTGAITVEGDTPNGIFENMNAEKWMEFDPSAMEMPDPDDFTANADVVDFDDVQAVGLFIFGEHQYHKNFRLQSFAFDGVLAVPAKGSFDVANNTSVAANSTIKFTTDMAVEKVGDGEIADADVASLFILKKDNASGADVAFDGTVDAAKKVFTLTPSAVFDFETTYYVALKNNVLINAGGFVSELTETTFKTAADIAALNAAISSAQALYDGSTEGSALGQYDAGSKAIFLAAIDAAKAELTGTQAVVDAAIPVLAAAVVEFGKAKVGPQEDVLFFENFDGGVDPNNTWQDGDANTIPALQGPNQTAHYIAEYCQISNSSRHENAATAWPGMSMWRNVRIQPTAATPQPHFTIAHINTTGKTDIKVQYAAIYNWKPTAVKYSLDGGVTWKWWAVDAEDANRPAEKPVSDATIAGSDWQLLTYPLPAEAENKADLWIRIEAWDLDTSGNSHIDDIKIFAQLPAPSIAFAVAETNVAIATTIAAAADCEVFNALDGSEITNASNLFVLKEGSADGADVAFSATIDAKKNFTITPSAALKPVTAYYVALKDRVIADADGVRVSLTSKTFTTGVDSAAVLAKIAEADGVLAGAGVEGEKNGDIIVGSKATLQAAINAAYVAMRAATNQDEMDMVGITLVVALANFEDAIVVVNYTALNAAITAAEAVKDAADYAAKYDEAARAAFETALTAAKAMSAKTDATQAEVDGSKDALELAQVTLISVDGATVGLAIYPNPADNFIKVVGVSDVTLNIYAVDGTQVLSVASYSGDEIEISSLPTGTYLVKVAGTTITLVKK